MTRFLFFLLFYLVVNCFAETCSTDRVYINKSSSCSSSNGIWVCRVESSNYTGTASCSDSHAEVTFVGTASASSLHKYESCSIYYAVNAYVEVNLTTCVKDSTDTLCDESRSECEGMGGVFSGSANNGCCIATCDQCGKLDDLVEQKRQICCNRGLAPPDKARQCRVEARSTCGMNWSTYLSNDNEFSCQDPSINAEASARYASECNDKSSSSGGGSSSSGGGSSSSGGSSGSSDECKECPYLDSILDTLMAQKAIVGSIYGCLTVPGQCGTSSKDSLSIPPWVAEKFDSTLDNQKKEIRELGLIDTSLLKLLDSVHLSLKNDTLTRQTITGVGTSIDSSIGAASDTSKKILRHIAEIMQTNESELARHIDSIISHLPDSVLDSIVKYQKYAIENFDSAFWGEGNGFTKIDDLTDSAIKYFKEGYRFDSIYNTHYRDSLGEIHQAIGDIGVNIGYALGYGDTASTTLRGDLAGIKGSLDRIGNMLDGAPVDTNNSGVYGSIIPNGQRLGDSIVNSYGWGNIKNMNVDSVYSAALDRVNSDSLGAVVDDSIVELQSKLVDSLARKNDSLKSHFTDSLDVWTDSLIVWAPFADFDSIIYSTLGAHVPNTDECPEDCQRWTASIPVIGLYSYTVDFGLCTGRIPLGGLSVLSFVKLLIRFVVAYTCIMVLYRTLIRLD